ncbi:MAG: ArsA family ATPase [Desulfurococcales archaeon]|nr:ArsA family ATPase [Desulfurococcales archaeon]
MSEPLLTQPLIREKGEKNKLTIVIGKGGVGKTTLSILFAHELSMNHKVLLVSLDQAMHLLEYLNLEKPMKTYSIKENLDVMQVDVRELIKKESKDYVSLIRSVMPGLSIVSADNVVESLKHNPGFEEEVYLRFISGLFNKNEYDYIVIDTPPTGVTYRILRLPRLYLFWFDELIKLRKRIINLRYTIARTMGREIEPSDPVLRRLYKLKGEYSTLLENLIKPNRTAYVSVLTPEPLPLFETGNTIKFLEEMKARVDLIIVNRLLSRESAENIGIYETQENVLRELKQTACKKNIPIIAIKHHKIPPRKLGEALKLLDLIEKITCTS